MSKEDMAEAPDLLPTPSGSPPPSQTPQSTLPTAINTATRKQHTELNRLIIDRLPLALPPHTSSPDRYAIGLAGFHTIYAAFEEAWQDLSTAVHDKQSPHNLEVAQWLLRLRPEGLPRGSIMRKDITYLCSSLGMSPPPQDEDLHTRVLDACHAKPYVLIAYSWVMYMAIFSGGRWIRQQLVHAGPGFWNRDASIGEKEAPLRTLGFRFLSFPGNDDGEDIKREYKARLAESERLLTDGERRDVLDAAKELFEMCIEVVGSLDGKVARRETARRVRTFALFACVVVALYLVWTRYTNR